jgi:lambda repressor-like predicted transcriptional regulator
MDDTDRPNLSFGDLSEIADDLYEMDKALWDCLRPLLMSKGIPPNIVVSGPRPPKLAAKIYLVLRNYSAEAFHSELNRYPRQVNPNFTNWLRKLAQRTEDHAIAVVLDIERSDPKKDFGYHVVTEQEMRGAIRSRLREEMEKHHQFNPPAPLKAPIPPAVLRQMQAQTLAGEPKGQIDPAPEPPPRPAPLATESPRRAFIEHHLEAKGWSVLDWANEAEVAHATAMDFLHGKTYPYRSTRLKLAKALGVPVEELPR